MSNLLIYSTNSMSQIIIMIALVMGIGLLFTIFILHQQKKATSTIDLDAWRADSEAIQTELLAKQAPWLTEWMKNAPIDAYTSATLPSNLGDLMKAFVKTSVRKVFTYATTGPTETPAYFVLSNHELHFFNTNQNGDLAEHLVFDKAQLEAASIKNGGSKKEMGIDISKFAGKEHIPQAYNIHISDSEYEYIIQALDRLTIQFSEASLGKLFSADAENIVKGKLVGELFFKKLGEAFPNLRIQIQHK